MSRSTAFAPNDHRAYNRQGDSFDRGETFSGVDYNLALDFERKRQFNKAESVFKYMAEHNPKFRDLEARTAQSRAMAETIILGGSAGRSNDSTMKPMKAPVVSL